MRALVAGDARLSPGLVINVLQTFDGQVFGPCIPEARLEFRGVAECSLRNDAALFFKVLIDIPPNLAPASVLELVGDFEIQSPWQGWK